MGASTPTTYSAQGTGFAPLQSIGASTPTTYSTQGTDFAPLQSMGASTPMMYGTQEFYSKSMGVHAPTTYWGFYITLLFVYFYSSKHTNVGEHGCQSFIDKVIEFQSITS